MHIQTPRHPATAENTEGYSPAELAALNGAFVEAWNYLWGDVEDMPDDEILQREKSLWDALAGGTDSWASARAIVQLEPTPTED